MSKQPNILLITTDEMRKDVLSCYGNKVINTPNLDRLAQESITFDRAYTASPWCLPSRCAIVTGLYPHNSGAYSNFRKCELNNGMPNLFNVFKEAGYTTSLVGKCHFTPVPYGAVCPDVTQPYEDVREYYVSLGIDHLELQDDKQVSVGFYDDYAKELDEAGYLEAYRSATWNKEYKKVFPFPGPAELFLLGLRFIGWAILSVLTLGIGFLFLFPYMTTSFVLFYEDIRGNTVTVNDQKEVVRDLPQDERSKDVGGEDKTEGGEKQE